MAFRPSRACRASAGALLVLAAATLAGEALAFCRTTTCNAAEDPARCHPDAHGCPGDGVPLSWPDVCVTFAVQERGSPLRHISAYDLDGASRRAFTAWISVDCGGGLSPSIGVIPLGGVECARVEFNPPSQGRAGAPNANIIVFRDDGWPYIDEQFTIAKTTLTFDTETGEIFDADIELNSFGVEISVGDDAVSHDLDAILTHEFGHFLGLAHSDNPSATMVANYSPEDLGFRTLSPDDQAAICSVYPPSGSAPLTCPPESGPHHGFSRECGENVWADGGCLSVPPRSRGRGPGLGAWLVLTALVGLQRLRGARARP